jgi:hypothetical protein
MGGLFLAYCGHRLGFCEKDEPISVENFFQMMGLVLAWESIGGGWHVL